MLKQENYEITTLQKKILFVRPSDTGNSEAHYPFWDFISWLKKTQLEL